MKKKTKKKLFISFYQYDMDDPEIIGFDSIEAAKKEARKDIRRALTNRKDWKEHLESFERDGSVTIGDILIYAREIKYRQSNCP